MGDCWKMHHVYVVITDPNKNDGQVLSVNWTTLRPESRADEITVVLTPDPSKVLIRDGMKYLVGVKHDDVLHDSFIKYRGAQPTKAEDLDRQIARAISIKPAGKLSEKAVSAIREGALLSTWFPSKYRNWL